MLRSFCLHCFADLSAKANSATVDCRIGVLCGCGARYCGIKCLVAAAQAHKTMCGVVQVALQSLQASRFRATKKTSQLVLDWTGHVQIHLLRADMLATTSDIVNALVEAAAGVRIAELFGLAQVLAQRALSLAAKGNVDEARALMSLGNVELCLSRYDAALAHYEASLKITKARLGDDDAQVAVVLDNISSIFSRQGRLDEAAAMCASALAIFKKAPGHQGMVATSHRTMGHILKDQRKFDEALAHYSIGLELMLKTKGETADAAGILNGMGAALLSMNRFDEAMEKLVAGLRILEKENAHIGVASCHQNIGNALMEQGKLAKALEHARKALAIYKATLAHDHADCADCHYLVGSVLVRSGKFAEALDEFDAALRIRKNVFGAMTLKVADTYQCMGMCYLALNKGREAVTFFEATMHIRTVLLGAADSSQAILKVYLAQAEAMLKAERSSAAASERK